MSQNGIHNYHIWLSENAKMTNECPILSTGSRTDNSGNLSNYNCEIDLELRSDVVNNLEKSDLRGLRTMETDGGICFGMSNVNINSENLIRFTATPNDYSSTSLTSSSRVCGTTTASPAVQSSHRIVNDYYYFDRKFPSANYQELNNNNNNISLYDTGSRVNGAGPLILDRSDLHGTVSYSEYENGSVFKTFFADDQPTAEVAYYQHWKSSMDKPQSNSVSQEYSDSHKTIKYSELNNNSNKFDLTVKSYKAFKMKNTLLSAQTSTPSVSWTSTTTSFSSSISSSQSSSHSSATKSALPNNCNYLNFKINKIKEEYKNMDKMTAGAPKKKWIRHYLMGDYRFI